MQEDEANKNAHLLVYAAVVYLTLFLYTRQREVHCSFFHFCTGFSIAPLQMNQRIKARAFSVDLILLRLLGSCGIINNNTNEKTYSLRAFTDQHTWRNSALRTEHTHGNTQP